ncbi:MAG: tetratricopeptide repeat protein [Sphaerochaetaceae bacterium]
MAKVDDITKGEKVQKKVTEFLNSNVKILICVGVALLLLIGILWLIIGLSDRASTAHQIKIDELQNSYRNYFYSSEKSDEELSALKGELQKLASKKKGSYPYLKAQYLLAMIAYDEGSYSEASDLFVSVSEKGQKTYLASLALFNAAVSKEVDGDIQSALEYYQNVYDKFGSDAPEAPKALYNIARLHENSGDLELAKAFLQQLADEYPYSEYGKLAKSKVAMMP